MKLKNSLFFGSFLFVAATTAVHADIKTWTGISADWNTADNWTASGVPAAADDVVFDGTGANPNISLSAPGPLKSLTFTAGQTAAVNINTIAGSTTPLVAAANISFGATATSLTVAAGSGNHKITGTGVSSGVAFRDFAFDISLTGFTFDIGSGTSFEINGRVGGGTTSANYAKNGTGTLILSGPNGGSSGWTFNGGSAMFNVNQGVVRFANAAASGNSGNKYTVASGAAIELSGGFNQSFGASTLNGTGTGTDGAIRSLSGINTIGGSGGIVLATNTTIGVDADTLTISPNLSGTGKSLTKVGAGTLTLSGTNTYSGGTIVSAGTLSLGASDVLANTTPVSLGAVNLSVGAGFTDTVGTLDVTGAATINLGSGTSALAFANSSAKDWTGGTLSITGTLGVSSIRFGTTSGGLTSGQLALISVNGSGAGAYTLDASGYLSSIKTWDGSDSADWGTAANWSGDALPGSGELATFTSTSPSGYDIYMGAAARTIKGVIFESTTGSTPYTINLQESSILTTSRTLTVGTGGIIVNAGNHTIKGAKLGSGNSGPLLLTAAPFNIATASSLTFDVRLRQSATGQSYSKTGTGTLVLNADNGGSTGWTFTDFTVSQGVLRFTAANAFGNSGNKYVVSAGAALELTGGVSQGIGATGTGTITLNGTGISSNGTLRSLSGNNSLTSSGGTGGVVLAANSSIGVDADTLTISQVVSGGFSLTKVGAGTLALSKTNTYGGDTAVSAGILGLGHATDTLPDATPVSLGAATLSVGAACADTVGTLDVTGAATINLGDATSKLDFADSSSKTWTGGTINITGTFVSGASIKFGIGGLIGGQLSKISATGWTGFGLDGSGFLTATAVGGATYSNWASLNGAGANLNDDHDNDGVDNGTEYFLGGPAGNTTGFTPLPGVTNSAGTLSVKWTKGPGYTGTYGTHFQVETSNSLADPWTQETSGGNVTLSGNDVIYTFPAPLGTKNFARLKVTGP